MAKFQKGESGNRHGRPVGAKGKRAAFRDELTAAGQSAAAMLVQTFDAAMAAGDFATAQRCASDALKFSYAPPTPDTPDTDELPPPAVINLVVSDMSKPIEH